MRVKHSWCATILRQPLKILTSSSSQKRIDALLSDLHTPGAGDGLTVVSAMRHADPPSCHIVVDGIHGDGTT